MQIDRTDQVILRELQRDCSRTIGEISDCVGLSKSACHRRIKLLEASGFIEGYAALINPKSIGYQLEFSVGVRLHGQSDAEMRRFEKTILKIPEVVSCRLMTGQTDFQLHVVAQSSQDYEEIHHRLAKIPEVLNLETSLVLRCIKGPATIPI